MIANRLFLLGNALVLLLVVGRRNSLPGGGLDALPWASFGTELQDIVTEASLSSAALLCLWIVLTVGWFLFTLIAERRHRIETTARLKKASSQLEGSDRASPGLGMDASTGLHDSSAHPNGESGNASTHRTGQSDHSEPSFGGANAHGAQGAHGTHGAGPHSTHSTAGHAGNVGQVGNGQDSAYRELPPSSANASDISGVLAGVKERNKSLSPEARAEIARLQAALQTLSDQASEEKKKDGATPDDVAPSASNS
ncbi:MAG: hypothetical protein FJY38_07435 [Betaproteobacteria bacterium]|nr:hypothetical protein [Betaproteobacteria bacterium]